MIGYLIGGIILAATGFMATTRKGQKPAATNLEATSSSNPQTPNILLFVLDDLDADTMERMLAANQLPNIKSKIVDGSTNFRNAYVPTSICSPSRASLLTGKFSHNHGVWHVAGTEGPQEFDDYLIRTGGAYLPSWLGNTYHRAFVGKFHLGFRHPQWDFFRQIEGYDPRPGMYKVNENGVERWPAVYQTKYIGDAAKQAIAESGNKPFFLLVSPTAAHANVSGWTEMKNHALGAYDGTPVALCQFPNEQTNGWRQHLVTVDFSSGAPIYLWWQRDSPQRDSGWGNWLKTGNASTIAPNTGNAAVVGWNILKPSPNVRRQQLVRQTGPDVEFYARDIVGTEPAKPWALETDESTLAGTGTMPVAGWSAVVFPSGVIRQQVIRGSETLGYVSYVRHRVPTSTIFTSWRLDPDWGETVVFGRLGGFTVIPTEGARYIIKLMVRSPGTAGFQWWQSGELIDFQELAVSGPESAARSKKASVDVPEEDDQYRDPAMEYSPGGHLYRDKDIEADKGKGSVPEGQTTIVSEVHPYYLLRAYAEGSWSPVVAGQTYNYGGNYPAGSLRKNRDPNGFDSLSAPFELPKEKGSYNRQLESQIPFYSTATWPDLSNPVLGNKQQQDYLRRLSLDRMEQLISVDRMVGELVPAAGPNTIIIFTSDNGHLNGEHRLSNKLTPHEESVRVPLYIRSPQAAPREIAQLVANIDITPTVIDYVGQSWTNPAFNIDGRSLKQVVETGSVANWRRSLLLEYHRPRGLSPGNDSATDWRFGLPDYLGLREIYRTSTVLINSLYVQYYADIVDPLSVIDYEYYHMDADPDQIDNQATGRIPELDNLMRNFYVASGETSRQIDTQGSPIS
jgi:arylsulfatase A-like enzyme